MRITRKDSMDMFRRARDEVQARNAAARKHAFTQCPSPESETDAKARKSEVEP